MVQLRPIWGVSYSFSTAFQTAVSDVDTSALFSLFSRLKTSVATYTTWNAYRTGSWWQAQSDESQYSTLCAVGTMSNDKYQQCLQQGGVWDGSS